MMRATVFAATALVSGVVASKSCCTKTIKKDVAIIGGGAAGSHAAVWLRDHGRTNVVIEKAEQLVSLSIPLCPLHFPQPFHTPDPSPTSIAGAFH